MITSKQRSKLRSLANTITPIFHIGKSGIEDNMIDAMRGALKTRELIKISILDTAQMSAREASDVLCKRLRAEGIQAIGKKVVIYKKNAEKPVIEI